MNLMLFKYGLPVIIGYVLFVGISGQFWPLRTPKLLSQRPSWLLGVWAGSSVTLTLMLVLNMAYHLPSDSVQSLLGPSLSLLATLIIPGLAVYFWYRRWIAAEMLAQHRQTNAVHHARAELKHQQAARNLEDPRVDRLSEQLADAEIIVHEEETLVEMAITTTSPEAALFNNAFDQSFSATQTALQKISELNASVDEPEFANDDTIAADTELPKLDIADADETIHPVAAAMSSTTVAEQDEMLADAQAEEILETQLLAREESVRSEMESALDAQLALKSKEFERELIEAGKIADNEAALRTETEAHLRITRKAMINLESQLRKLEATKADDMIQLESQLDEKIRAASKAEANAMREQQTRTDLETDLTKSRQELLQARTEIRKNTTARAKALASANKAVSFARQAVEARAQTESDLSSLKDRVLTQQTTISSLIKALETEKNRHRDELASLKSEFAQKESELEIAALNNLSSGDAANQTLTTRLVKKVAKARPVV